MSGEREAQTLSRTATPPIPLHQHGASAYHAQKVRKACQYARDCVTMPPYACRFTWQCLRLRVTGQSHEPLMMLSQLGGSPAIGRDRVALLKTRREGLRFEVGNHAGPW